MSQHEEQLRAIVLIAIVAVSASVVGSVLFLSNTTLGVVGVFATLVFGLFSVYNHYFELPEGMSDTVHEVELEESRTAGTRPPPGEKGFSLNTDDFVLSQLSPKRVSQVIYNSPNWQKDGHGGYSTWWRPRLRRLFFSDVFSNKAFELTLLGLTMGSFVLLYFVFLSFIPDNLSMTFIEPLTEVYPSHQSVEATLIVTCVSITIGFIGTAYFDVKSGSTCPVCRSPFALQSKTGSSSPKTEKSSPSLQTEIQSKRRSPTAFISFTARAVGRGMSQPDGGNGA